MSLLFLCAFSPVFAQMNEQVLNHDSSRTVDLKEVTLTTSKKTPLQQLVIFFRANNSSTIEDILSRLPEVSLVRRGSYGMEPTIRSFNGGQINVLVDGMRIHGACTDKMDPATIYIEPINLENLQVQTAAAGFMSGSSIGGTINMKMAEPDYLNNHTVTGMVTSGYQSAAKIFYESARLNYSSGRWAFRVSGTYRNNKSYRSGGGKIIPFSQFEKLNYSFSAKFQQNQYTYLKADLLADDGWNIGYPALPMDVGYAGARIASFSIHHENKLNRLYKWQAKIYANQIKHFMDDTHRPFVPMHMDMPGYSKTYGIYGEGEMKINAKQKLLLRADGSTNLLNASMTMYQAGQLPMYMLTWPDNRKNQFGLSASWLLQIDSSLKVQVTGRTDLVRYQLVSTEAKDQVSIFGYPSANRNNFLKNISTSVSKNISHKISTNASLSYSERIPTASELYGFYLFNSNDGFDYIGNPGLNIEQSLQADISALYNWGKNRIQLTYYYSKVYNFITGLTDPSVSAMTIGATGVKSFINIANASITGLELSAVLKPAAPIDIISTLRYTRGKDNDNNPLPSIAPLKNTSSFRYQLNKAFVQLEYDAALKQNRINLKTGEDKTDGYILLNARFGYNTNLFGKMVELQSGVENVLDKKYHEHLDWGNISRPGRNIYVLVKCVF